MPQVPQLRKTSNFLHANGRRALSSSEEAVQAVRCLEKRVPDGEASAEPPFRDLQIARQELPGDRRGHQVMGMSISTQMKLADGDGDGQVTL